nr:hypothetical protein Iba_chr14bCG8670 [Ipomoea batatas]
MKILIIQVEEEEMSRELPLDSGEVIHKCLTKEKRKVESEGPSWTTNRTLEGTLHTQEAHLVFPRSLAPAADVAPPVGAQAQPVAHSCDHWAYPNVRALRLCLRVEQLLHHASHLDWFIHFEAPKVEEVSLVHLVEVLMPSSKSKASAAASDSKSVGRSRHSSDIVSSWV